MPMTPAPESPVATSRSWADSVESDETGLPPLPPGWAVTKEPEWITAVTRKKVRGGHKKR